ncbi:MAG TPA: class I SAM-dependent methyltransferase [Nostocaceae cyanobacterium]|nr:class I SAM-dependent methyltransferase [Nostocaceae cyanobacterium]
MSSALDYEQIAHLYDSYLHFTDDLPFFLQECKKINGSVLELMCGTGRISIPLLQAGVNLVCVDASPGMLNILHQKLIARALKADIMQADVTNLQLESTFDLVLLPFQSFHELHTQAEQLKALNEIGRSLKPNGRFICTLHNPRVRIKSIIQGATHYGTFPRLDGDGFVSLSVDLNYDSETNFVRGYQTICELDSTHQKVAEHKLSIQFSLIEFDVFQQLIQLSGFAIEEVLGNYDYSPFVPDASPFIIVSTRKLVQEGRRQEAGGKKVDLTGV